MTTSLDIMDHLASITGQELSIACQQNDIPKVRALTSTNMDPDKWSAAVLIAASGKAVDVADFCMKTASGPFSTTDNILWTVLGCESDRLDLAYRFLVESNLVNPKHAIDRGGQLLGAIAGMDAKKQRHSLVEYLLERGVDPNQDVDMHGGLYALTAAAGWSDVRMLGLLLDHGAVLPSSGALIFAAEKGRQDNVKYLLSRGADINEITPFKSARHANQQIGAALHGAVSNGHVEVMDTLLDAGADVALKDAMGRTPLEIAMSKGMDETILAKLS